MAGYAATDRIQRGAVHARPGSPGAAVAWELPILGYEIVELDRDGEMPPGRPTLRDRLGELGEALDQLTWYLRSPDSWR